MPRIGGIEGIVTDWMADQANARVPEYVEDLLARTGRTPQRPAWTFAGRWLPALAVERRRPAIDLGWRWVALVVLLLILSLLVSAAQVGRQAPLPPPFGRAANGEILYSAGGDIQAVDHVTGRVRTVVAGAENDAEPRWSRDGTRFAFVRALADGAALFSARADGSGLTRLTPSRTSWILSFEFSPDGHSVLVLTLDHGKRSLLVVAADGQGERRLDVGRPVISAVWRPPDGREIVAALADTRGTNGLYILDGDGRIERTLVTPAANQTLDHVAVSPDGTRIAYTIWDTTADALTARLRIVAADGSGDRAAPPPSPARWQALGIWSNDGRWLVTVRGYADDFSRTLIAVVPSDLTDAGTELPGFTPALECCPRIEWAPDDSAVLTTPAGPRAEPLPQVLWDPVTGHLEHVSWGLTSDQAWRRTAP